MDRNGLIGKYRAPLLSWEIENYKNRRSQFLFKKKKLALKFALFTIGIVILTIILPKVIFELNIASALANLPNLERFLILQLISFFVLLTYFFTYNIFNKIDEWVGFKTITTYKISFIYNLKIFKILILNRNNFFVITPQMPYYNSVLKGQIITLKKFASLRLIDYFINSDEIKVTDAKNKTLLTSNLSSLTTTLSSSKNQIMEEGFSILENIYTPLEIENILKEINKSESEVQPLIKNNNLILCRGILKKAPQLKKHIFNENLNTIIDNLLGKDYFVVSSIYFNKSEYSKWGVPYHQDRRIIVEKKVVIKNYDEWFDINESNSIAVRAPLEIQQSIYGIRIHLDDTDVDNGALRVIPKSHLNGFYNPESIDFSKEVETLCNVPEGGIMIMSNLIMHSSGKTTSNKKRRVIHIEFSNKELPKELIWAERDAIF